MTHTVEATWVEKVSPIWLNGATKPPVWLLDVDGVVNAIPLLSGNPPASVRWVNDWIRTSAISSRTWPILASRSVVNFIKTVHNMGLAEIRWHTTWQHHANNVSVALGLPEFPIQEAPEVDDPMFTSSRSWWKLPAVHRVLAEGRSVVWTDDDINIELTNTQLAQLMASEVESLLICPRSMTGLTETNLKEIHEFLHRHRKIADDR